jgi:hypothetical protein
VVLEPPGDQAPETEAQFFLKKILTQCVNIFIAQALREKEKVARVLTLRPLIIISFEHDRRYASYARLCQ